MVRTESVGEEHSHYHRPDLHLRSNPNVSKAFHNLAPPQENAYEQPYEELSPYPKHHHRASDNGHHHGHRDYAMLDAQPALRHVIDCFEEFLEATSPLSEHEVYKYRQMTKQQKWRIICEQEQSSPTHKPNYYVGELRKHGGVSRKRRSWGKSHKDVSPLSPLLQKLKRDLLYAPDRFREEFVSPGCGGIAALLHALYEVQKDQSALNTSKKSKLEFYKHIVQDELDCLVCLKYACKHEDGLISLLHSHNSLESVAECMFDSDINLNIVTLQILKMCCKTAGGFEKVIKVTSHMRVKHQEENRFQSLVQMLSTSSSFRFKRAGVEFFNELWKCTQMTNAKVYVQFELEQAGFDPDKLERDLRGNDPELTLLREELDKWRKQHINVGEARTDLQDMETRNNYLREEIDRLNSEIENVKKNEEKHRRGENQWKAQSEEYRERAAELQDTVEDLKRIFVKETGVEPDSQMLKEAEKPLDIYGTVRIQRGQINDTENNYQNTSDKSPEYNTGSIQSATTMPLPPVPPPNFLSKTVRKKVVDVKVNLPSFHWVVIPEVTGTIFEDIDDEAKLREIDFSEFESLFKINTHNKKKTAGIGPFERQMMRAAKKITFVGIDRAKNMIITKRSIGLTTRDIKKAIDVCNNVPNEQLRDAKGKAYTIAKQIPSDLAELLLKYQPTKEEIKKLAENADNYEQLGEAEQFLFHMAEIQRLESKLTVLTFMGVYDETVDKIIPDMEAMTTNSKRITESMKLKKILEIVLAFGNYMNSNRKGYAMGFKLESLEKLQDVKSTDRSMTLLHYLEEFVLGRYPELYDFDEDVDLDLERGTCYQAVYSGVLGLRKGLDLVKYEMEKQPENKKIVEFHERAAVQVARVAESFRAMETEYEKVCKLFGLNYKVVDTEDVFKPLLNFATAFQNAGEENRKRREKERQNHLKPPTPRFPISSPRQPTSISTYQSHIDVPRLDLSNSWSSQNTSLKTSQNESTRFPYDKTDHVNGAYGEIRPMNSDEELYDDVTPTFHDDMKHHNRKPNGNDRTNGKSVKFVMGSTRSSGTSSTESQKDHGLNDYVNPVRHKDNPLGTPRVMGVSASTPELKSMNNQHVPVIMRSLSPVAQGEKRRGKHLPRLPMDITNDEYQTYVNLKNLKRKDQEKVGNEVLPNKPHISMNGNHTDSAGPVYEELPSDRLHKHIPQTKPSSMNPPALPPKNDKAPPKKGKVANRALPNRPPVDRTYSVEETDVINLLDEVIDAEAEKESYESYL